MPGTRPLLVIIGLVLALGYGVQKWIFRHHRQALRQRELKQQQEEHKQVRDLVIRLRHRSPSISPSQPDDELASSAAHHDRHS